MPSMPGLAARGLLAWSRVDGISNKPTCWPSLSRFGRTYSDQIAGCYICVHNLCSWEEAGAEHITGTSSLQTVFGPAWQGNTTFRHSCSRMQYSAEHPPMQKRTHRRPGTDCSACSHRVPKFWGDLTGRLDDNAICSTNLHATLTLHCNGRCARGGQLAGMSKCRVGQWQDNGMRGRWTLDASTTCMKYPSPDFFCFKYEHHQNYKDFP